MCRITRKKTYENIKALMRCLHDAVLLFKQEEEIQIEQIKEDVKENDNKKILQWISENAREFREYLEKIEMLAKKYKNNPEGMQELFIEIDDLKKEYNK